MAVWHFIPQNLSFSPFHCLNMTNNNETDIKHQIIIIIIIDDDDNDLVFHVRIIIIHREIRKNNFLIPEIIWRPFSPFH